VLEAMNLPAAVVRMMAAIAVLALTLTGYLACARPYQPRWGATAQEVARAMPGDELDPQPTFLATRAITIDVTAAQIWPWLVQMGHGRAGFYGLAWLTKPRSWARQPCDLTL
jgi:hypothetical protein